MQLKFGSNILDTPKSQDVKLIFTSFQLVSLMEILQKYAYGFYLFGTLLNGVTAISKVLTENEETEYCNESITAENILTLKKRCSEIKKWCVHLKLKESVKGIDRVLNLSDENFKRGEIAQIVGELHRRIKDELEDHCFLYLPPDKIEFYDNERPFGDNVYNNFPSVRKELKEAGNCLALGLNTACVFHLMRVVEVAGKMLLFHMGATKHLPKVKGGKKIKAIDLCTWGDMNTAMREGLKAKKILANFSVKRKATYQFCNDAIESFGCFQIAWRDKVSHSNTVYDEYDAKKIMENTGRLMKHLATRVKSKK